MPVMVPTVLGSVTTIFAWMLQYMNGGVLNALVKTSPSNIGDRPSFEVQDATSIGPNLLKLLLGKIDESNLAMLKALPADLGGGAAGVQNATAYPNREGTLIVASLVALLSTSDYSEEKFRISKESQNIFCCGLHIVVILFTALCLVGLIVCLGYYFGAASTVSEVLADSETTKENVVPWLQGNTSTFSLGGLLKFGTLEIIRFLGESVQLANAPIIQAVNRIDNDLIQKALPVEISEFSAKLIVAFKLKAFQQALHELASNVNDVSKASDYITNYRDPVISAVLLNETNLNDTLETIMKKCPDQNDEASKLKPHFEQNKVAKIPEDLNGVLRSMSDEMKSIVTNLDGVITKLETINETIMENIEKELDFQAILAQLEGIWTEFDSVMDSMEEPLQEAMTTVSEVLGKFSSPVKVLLFVLAIPFLLAGILFVLFLVIFITEAIYRQMFSLTGNSASEVAARDPWIAQSCVCGGGKFCCCSCLLLLFVLILGSFACLAITLNGFVGVEVCPYIANTTGIKMTDYVLNSKVQTIWDGIVSSTEPSGSRTGYPMSIISQKPPQDLLYALEVRCEPSGTQATPVTGLLGHMGINSLVNFSAFVEDPALNECIQQVKGTLVDNIAAQKLGDAIKEEDFDDLKKNFNTLKSLISTLKLPDTVAYLIETKFKIYEIENLEQHCPTDKQQFANLISNLQDSNKATEELGENYNALESKSGKLSVDDLISTLSEFKAPGPAVLVDFWWNCVVSRYFPAGNLLQGPDNFW
ncbi:unnamed protein product [Schistocephalus solidus]|uniref:ANK_REP_REGION domain-containing protein n=1 Tax=Schistocephalus solidus TaxID=70667 RepID=A0A183T0Y2_SCHSO|nr:unnamed protein product [Schistocephalus solidus]